MRICVLIDNPFVSDVRPNKTVNAMLEQGHHVTVLGWIADSVRESVSSDARLIDPRHRDRFHLKLFSAKDRAHTNLLARIYAYHLRSGSSIVDTYLKVLSREPCDMIYANDLSTLEAAGKAARIRGIPFLYDAHEIMLPVLRERIVEEKSWKVKLQVALRYARSSWVESYYSRRAFAVITVNSMFEEFFRNSYGLTRTLFLLNTPRKSDLEGEVVPLRRIFSLREGDRLVAYHGATLGVKRGVVELANAAALLPEQIHVALIGDGGRVDEIKQLAMQSSKKNLHWHPKLPYQSLLATLRSEVDLAVNPILGTNLNHRLAGPNKLYECLLAGVPQLVSDQPYLRRIVEETGLGLVMPGKVTAENLAYHIGHFFEVAQAGMPRGFESPYYWESEKLKLQALIGEIERSLKAGPKPLPA